MTCGIYSILNTQNGKIYVGQSVRIESRFAHHKWELKSNRHINYHLQSSFNKYGEDVFEFNVLEECEPSKLNDNEIWWIEYFNSTDRDNGFNFETGGNSRFDVCKETREKLSKANSGENNPFYGKTHSKETRNKIRDARKGSKLSQKDRDNLSEIKNTTGFFRVYKEYDDAFKQGFTWRYQYHDGNDKIRRLSCVSLDGLKEKVLTNGLEWREL